MYLQNNRNIINNRKQYKHCYTFDYVRNYAKYTENCNSLHYTIIHTYTREREGGILYKSLLSNYIHIHIKTLVRG